MRVCLIRVSILLRLLLVDAVPVVRRCKAVMNTGYPAQIAAGLTGRATLQP